MPGETTTLTLACLDLINFPMPSFETTDVTPVDFDLRTNGNLVCEETLDVHNCDQENLMKQIHKTSHDQDERGRKLKLDQRNPKLIFVYFSIYFGIKENAIVPYFLEKRIIWIFSSINA